MRLSRYLQLSAVALSAVLLSSCGSGGQNASGEDGKPRIGIVTNNPAEFWNIVEAGARKAADEDKVDLQFRRPKDSAATAQKDLIEDLMARGVKGIGISVIDPVNQKDFLNGIADRVPLLTLDNDAPDSKRICYVGTDNYNAGRDAGKLVKQCLPDGGVVALFVGQPDPLNARQRRQGVLDELAGEKDAKGPKYGNYELFGTFYDQTDAKKAEDQAADALSKITAEPEKICLVGLWAYNPPAILNAVKKASKEGKVHIVGFDEQQDTLLGIDAGYVRGTIVQQPFEFGYQSVKLLAARARGDRLDIPADGINYVPHMVVMKAVPAKTDFNTPVCKDVATFQKELSKLMGK